MRSSFAGLDELELSNEQMTIALELIANNFINDEKFKDCKTDPKAFIAFKTFLDDVIELQNSGIALERFSAFKDSPKFLGTLLDNPYGVMVFNDYGGIALERFAAFKNDIKFLQELLNTTSWKGYIKLDKNGITLERLAAFKNNPEFLDIIVKNPNIVIALEKNGRPLERLAAFKNNPPLFSEFIGYPTKVISLIKRKIPFNELVILGEKNVQSFINVLEGTNQAWVEKKTKCYTNVEQAYVQGAGIGFVDSLNNQRLDSLIQKRKLDNLDDTLNEFDNNIGSIIGSFFTREEAANVAIAFTSTAGLKARQAREKDSMLKEDRASALMEGRTNVATRSK